mmetsp:Transcript_56940/g.127981  ORF Transcript_56940/g.127981 Transcript_56940/m.127981 type:complete len:207 (+) Transcript_56940:36-656(+)
MDDEQKSLKHLLEAAHLYALRAPAVSRSLILQMRALASRVNYKLHSSVTQRFCARCSQVAVPGWNCQTTVSPKRRRCRRKKDARQVAKAISNPKRGASKSTLPPAAAKRTTRVRITPGNEERQTSSEPRKAGNKRVQQVCWLCGHQQLLQVISKQQPPADAAQARKAAAASEAAAARAAAKRAKAAKKECAAKAAIQITAGGLRTL